MTLDVSFGEASGASSSESEGPLPRSSKHNHDAKSTGGKTPRFGRKDGFDCWLPELFAAVEQSTAGR